MDLRKYIKDPVTKMEEGVLGMSQRTSEKTRTDIWQTPRKPEYRDQLLTHFSEKRPHEKAQWATAVGPSSKSGQARGETGLLSAPNPSSGKLLEDRSQMMQKGYTIFKKDIGEKIATASQPPHKTGSYATRVYKSVEKIATASQPQQKTGSSTTREYKSVAKIATASQPQQKTGSSTTREYKSVEKIATACQPQQKTGSSTTREYKSVAKIATASQPQQKTVSSTTREYKSVAKIATASQPQQNTESSTTREYKSVEKDPSNKLQVKTRLHMTSEKQVVNLSGARDSRSNMSCDRLPQSKKMTTVIVKEEFVGMPLGETKLDLSEHMNILEMKTQKKAVHKPKSAKSTKEERLDARIESCEVALEGYMQDRERPHLDIENGRLSPQEVHEHFKMKRWNFARFFLRMVGRVLLDVLWKTLVTLCVLAIAYRQEIIDTHFMDTVGPTAIACFIFLFVAIIKFFVFILQA